MKRRENNDFLTEATFKQYLWCDNTNYIDFFNGTVTLRIRMAGNGKYFAQELGRGPKHWDITQRMTTRLILHIVEALKAEGKWDAIAAEAWGNTQEGTAAQIIPFTTGAA